MTEQTLSDQYAAEQAKKRAREEPLPQQFDAKVGSIGQWSQHDPSAEKGRKPRARTAPSAPSLHLTAADTTSLARDGVAATLQYLRETDQLESEKPRASSSFGYLSLKRTDELGKTMSAKELYKRLSRKMHGHQPGLAQQERTLRAYVDEKKAEAE
ncbi:SART-1 protein [Carpediemonas membranifera]|uniref:SART-1 protein n=1 Tax=Carpediemonas membranifera TaxID=201153 RepID=A0A8J6B512_9EUKA|nr:SART-1 protein [Carpediemonas membranifera]|eukprot:KAG9393017.1 SART-1 protein [Carpediemonas membranifera]